MTRPDTRRRRRNHDTPEPERTVTLNSTEFIDKLRREYRENNKAALLAKKEAQRAFGDAAKFEQQVAELGAQEQAALAKVQQAQNELQQVQAQRAEVGSYIEQARNYGTEQMARHESHATQAADARTVLESFEIDVPDEAEPSIPSPPTGPMLAVMAIPPADTRMDEAIARIDDARKTELSPEQREEDNPL